MDRRVIRFAAVIGLTFGASALLYAQEAATWIRGLNLTRGNLTVSTGTFRIGSGTITATVAPTGGDSGYGNQFNINPVAGTAGLRQGGLDVNLNRAADQALTAWDGNPDTAINIRADNRANNTAGGGIRALDMQARNRGTNQSWVKAVDIGARNDSGKQLTDQLNAVHIRVENYGNVATDLTGLDIELSDENSNVDPHTKAGIVVRNTDLSGMGAVDSVLRLSHTSTNGFSALVDFDAVTAGANTTIIDQITAAATTAAYQIRVVMPDGNSGWINVYSTSGTGP